VENLKKADVEVDHTPSKAGLREFLGEKEDNAMDDDGEILEPANSNQDTSADYAPASSNKRGRKAPVGRSRAPVAPRLVPTTEAAVPEVQPPPAPAGLPVSILQPRAPVVQPSLLPPGLANLPVTIQASPPVSTIKQSSPAAMPSLLAGLPISMVPSPALEPDTISSVLEDLPGTSSNPLGTSSQIQGTSDLDTPISPQLLHSPPAAAAKGFRHPTTPTRDLYLGGSAAVSSPEHALDLTTSGHLATSTHITNTSPRLTAAQPTLRPHQGPGGARLVPAGPSIRIQGTSGGPRMMVINRATGARPLLRPATGQQIVRLKQVVGAHGNLARPPVPQLGNMVRIQAATRPHGPGAGAVVLGARQVLVGARPAQPDTRPVLVGARSLVPGARPVLINAKPMLPGGRPRLVIARPGLPGARLAVPGARPGVQNLSMIRPTTVKIIRSPPSNPEQVKTNMVASKPSADTMTDKMLDDLPNNMIKLIKVNDSKKKDPKEKDSDEDAFMDMFDDETRKLAENFDMFESANPAKPLSDEEGSQEPALASPTTTSQEEPGTPGTPRLMICTPGPTPEGTRVLPGGTWAPSTPLAPGAESPMLRGRGGLRVRGVRPRGGQMVRLRGGPVVRPVRPGGPGARPGLRPAGPVMRLGGPGARAGLRPVMVAVRPRPPAVPVRSPEPAPPATAQGDAATDILMTKDTTAVHPKKEAAEVIDIVEESPPKPKRAKAMERLTHLGISVSRKKGETSGGAASHLLPASVAQSPSITRPNIKKKVELELSEEQIEALKSLGMM